jgi:hypothetical protein
LRDLIETSTAAAHGDITIAYELSLCDAARADVVAIGRILEGWEIKSDLDNMLRLPHQVCIYSRVLNMAHLVTTERHMPRAKSMVPTWWGVHVAGRINRNDPVTIKTVRRARWNRHRDRLLVTELLYLMDMKRLLRDAKAPREWLIRSKYHMAPCVLAVVPFDRICLEVASRLRKKRQCSTTDTARLPG